MIILFEMIVLFPHLHGRRTGITTSLEGIISVLNKRTTVKVFGRAIKKEFLNTTLFGVIKTLLKINNSEACIWHANRNNEAIIGVFLRIFFPALKVVFVRHSDSKPSLITEKLLKKADAVVTLSKKVQESLPVSSVCIHHGVDVEYFNSINNYESLLPDGNKYIGIIGRVRRLKGQIDVIHATTEFLKNNNDWKIVILGSVTKSNKNYIQEIFEYASSKNIQDQIIHIDEIRDPRIVYQDLELVVVPSYTEGFSMVPLEAMAMNVPVIATKNVGIHDELIIDDKSGWLYDAGDVNALKLKIMNVCANNELRDKAVKNAREIVVKNWTTETEAAAYLRLYENVSCL